ncbi:MAG TPA: 3'(2'),5'-bisphosphate nucleotidase CysQ [Rhizomicrobium sp.]|nr:3'(2'),5'-bisphosphate nucleotidase CysQ [Rhizomicrobium sp.]
MPAPDDLALIEAAAKEAGGIARRYFGGHYKTWDKGKGQPVTDADIAVDRFLHGALLGARPEYGWLSEETRDDPARLGKARVFVVDPIDGTIAFIKGRPYFTVSIAVVEAGRPVAAVIFNPVLEECFAASAGRGAHLGGVQIHASQATAIQDCRMLGDKQMFAHPGWSVAPNTAWPPMHMENRNSIAYRMALVADGRFDAALALSAKCDWDLAAGDLIVREAGGSCGDYRGNTLTYNGAAPIQRTMLCAAPDLFPLLVEKMKFVTLP